MTASNEVARRDPAIQDLLSRAKSAVARDGRTFEQMLQDLIDSGLPSSSVAPAEAAPPPVKPLTDAQRAALVALPTVYGRVAPATSRELSDDEVAKLVAERLVLDLVAKLVKERKEVGVREVAAHHLDHLAERTGRVTPEDVYQEVDGERVLVAKASLRDKDGHYLDKTEHVDPESGKRWARTTSSGEPRVDSARLLAAHEAGVFDRAEYLALTSLPVVARVFDKAKASEAVRKDPSLLARLQEHAVVAPAPTTSIYLR
jgi:hypothetical protein